MPTKTFFIASFFVSLSLVVHAEDDTSRMLDELESVASAASHGAEDALKLVSHEKTPEDKTPNWNISLGWTDFEVTRQNDFYEENYQGKGLSLGISRQLSKQFNLEIRTFTNQLAGSGADFWQEMAYSLGAVFIPFHIPMSSESYMAPAIIAGVMNRPYFDLPSFDPATGPNPVIRETRGYGGFALSLGMTKRIGLLGQWLYLSDRNSMFNFNLVFGI